MKTSDRIGSGALQRGILLVRDEAALRRARAYQIREQQPRAAADLEVQAEWLDAVLAALEERERLVGEPAGGAVARAYVREALRDGLRELDALIDGIAATKGEGLRRAAAVSEVAALVRRELETPQAAEQEPEQRRADNAAWQVRYMCDEIARALGQPVQSPAGTVESVRQLMAYAEDCKRAAASGAEAPNEADIESARCSCEWMDPVTGEIYFDWPALLDSRCAVHMQKDAVPGRIVQQDTCTQPSPTDAADQWAATIEQVAQEEMAAWKAARFEHAYEYARRIAQRVIAAMTTAAPPEREGDAGPDHTHRQEDR